MLFFYTFDVHFFCFENNFIARSHKLINSFYDIFDNATIESECVFSNQFNWVKFVVLQSRMEVWLIVFEWAT
jgi:hypothetical protein